MEQRNFLPAAIVIAALIIGGAIMFSQNQKTPSSDQPKENNAPAEETAPEITINENDHIRGNTEAPVTIIEWSDFQCPYCASFHPVAAQAVENFPDQVRLIYKHFPLGFHENAQSAAEASECAAEQDKFWEFTDGLFENQSRLGDDLYQELSQGLELDTAQFEECVSSRKYQSKVEDDYEEGVAAGITGTPGGYVNDQKIPGAIPYDQLEAMIQNELTQ